MSYIDICKRYNKMRVEDRTIAEMIGISKALIADGSITELEANFLVQWLEENKKHADGWPFDVVYTRVHQMLEDGAIDSGERTELFALLRELVGPRVVADNIASFATTLPLTKPVPHISFAGKEFCFTGTFAFGQRKDCEKAVKALGASTLDRVTQRLNYLVIGLIGSDDWIHSTFGRKIQKAVAYNTQNNSTIAIIGEDDWASALCGCSEK